MFEEISFRAVYHDLLDPDPGYTPTKSHVAYPSDAPPLKVGMPYRVEVEDADDETHRSLFSLDPNLEIADNFLTRIVTISR